MTTQKEIIKLYNGEVEVTFYPNSHQYRVGGKIISSVSGICGMVDKSDALIYWATNLTKEFLLGHHSIGNSITEEIILESVKQHTIKKEEACDTGKRVHDWCENYIKGIEQDIPTEDHVNNGILAFLKWVKDNHVEFIYSEKLVYSKKYNFVGRFDLVAKVNGVLTLIDFKTSKRFYRMEMGMQTAGYQLAYEEESGEKIEARLILRFDKETGEFETHYIDDYEKDKEAFLAALTLKTRQKETNKY